MADSPGMNSLHSDKMILNLMPPLIVLAFGVIFLAWSYIYEDKAQQVPVLVGWSLIVLCVLDVIASTGTAPGNAIKAFFTGTIVGEASGDAVAAQPMRKVLVAMAWPVAFVVFVYFVGFLIAIPIYVFVFVAVQGKKSIKVASLSAVAATAFTWIVFSQLMQYEVFPGLLFGGQ
jgi:hypothetical protein